MMDLNWKQNQGSPKGSNKQAHKGRSSELMLGNPRFLRTSFGADSMCGNEKIPSFTQTYTSTHAKIHSQSILFPTVHNNKSYLGNSSGR